MTSARTLPFSTTGFYHEAPLAEFPALTHCGDALCARGHWLARHRHRGFEFLCLARGSIRWRLGGKTHLQRMGDIFAVHPGEWHETAAPSREETHQLWIGLELARLGPDGARVAQLLRSSSKRLMKGGPALEPVIRAIVGQMVTPLPRRMPVVRAFVQSLLALIEQNLAGEKQPSPARAVLPYSYNIRKALAHLERHLDRRVPLAELAAVATMRQPSHFCACFRREVGITPAVHHLRRRLTEARAALLQPRAGSTEIALRYGFSSSQHFSTAFHRFFGVTPRAWQRTNREAKKP